MHSNVLYELPPKILSYTHIGLFPQLNSVVQVTFKLKYIIDYLLLIFKSNSLPYIIAVSEL